MQSRTTEDFRKRLSKLPKDIQERARKNFELWVENPRHPSLQFKKVHPSDPIYSARVSRDYRAVGFKDDDTFVWFWIGPHDEYERLLSRM
jgi:mRNA-degrading endonuclease RelE of RelBE toxin-antitoxin system